MNQLKLIHRVAFIHILTLFCKNKYVYFQMHTHFFLLALKSEKQYEYTCRLMFSFWKKKTIIQIISKFTLGNFEKRHLTCILLECPDSQYGRNCLQTCSKNCHVSYTCDKMTGACHGGCIEGWKLPQCNKGT